MKKAFTLAEVLITLTIVGTIAALTVPHVLKDYKYKLYATQLKKVYSEVVDAVEMAKNDENADHFYETKVYSPESGAAKYFIENYMVSIMKYNSDEEGLVTYNDCGTDGCQRPTGGDGESKYEKLDGSAAGDVGLFGESCIKIKSGSVVCAKYIKIGEDGYIAVTTDINGKKNAPNIAGRDVFSMLINKDGIVADEDGIEECGSTGALGGVNKYTAGCLKEIMDHDWQMEY